MSDTIVAVFEAEKNRNKEYFQNIAKQQYEATPTETKFLKVEQLQGFYTDRQGK